MQEDIDSSRNERGESSLGGRWASARFITRFTKRHRSAGQIVTRPMARPAIAHRVARSCGRAGGRAVLRRLRRRRGARYASASVFSGKLADNFRAADQIDAVDIPTAAEQPSGHVLQIGIAAGGAAHDGAQIGCGRATLRDEFAQIFPKKRILTASSSVSEARCWRCPLPLAYSTSKRRMS
jgi:hypothetical protein